MKILELEQGSAEWLSARCGVFSASNFDKLITTKGEPSKQAQKYIFQVAAEKVSGIKEESFQSAAMLKGIETEAEAVEFYELTQSAETQKVGFVLHENGLWGCSPDRLVGEDGLLEIKCPLPHTQVEYLLEENLYQDYFQQVQGQLFITGRKWCDLMSYCRGLRPLIKRIEPDTVFFGKLEKILTESSVYLDSIVEKISA